MVRNNLPKHTDAGEELQSARIGEADVNYMLAVCQKRLDEFYIKEVRSADDERSLKVVKNLLAKIALLNPRNETALLPWFLALAAEVSIQLRDYEGARWEQNPRSVLHSTAITAALLLFEDAGEVFMHLMNFLWRYQFEDEIRVVETQRLAESALASLQMQLPFKEVDKLATITKKEYVGMLSGNVTTKLRVMALDEDIVRNLRIENFRPYWKDSGEPVSLDEIKSHSMLSVDGELLHVIYTELLELYRMADPARREAYKRGETIAFNPRRMLRKMTQHPQTYDLFSKLTQYNGLYTVKITDPNTNKISITKVLTVESYDEEVFKINASALMEMIEEVEQEEQDSRRKLPPAPGHAFFLPMGGKKGSQHAKILTEHIIATLKQAGQPKPGEAAKRVNINLWKIMGQYPQIMESYANNALTRNKNVWLKRLVESLYKSLYESVAPHYMGFVIHPEIVDKKSKKAVNIPTSTTIKGHKMYISHKGRAG